MSRLKRTLKTLRLTLLIVLMAPIWLVMIFSGFPPPLPPWLRTKPTQTQSQPYRKQRRQERPAATSPTADPGLQFVDSQGARL